MCQRVFRDWKRQLLYKMSERERTRIVFRHLESTMLCIYESYGGEAQRQISQLSRVAGGRPKAGSFLRRARDLSSLDTRRDVAW
jgi:hypothetical protein